MCGNQVALHLLSHSESGSAALLVFSSLFLLLFFYCLPSFYSPSLFPPPLPPFVFRAPVPTPARPSPAGQRVQKAAKIKKKAVCNKQGKITVLWPLFLHSHLYLFIYLICFPSLSVCRPAPLCPHLLCASEINPSQVSGSVFLHSLTAHIYTQRCR